MIRQIPFRFFFVFSLILISASTIFSQEKDARLWQGVVIQKKITKELDFRFKDQFRLRNNFTTFQSNLFDSRLSYKLFDGYLRPAIGYRFTLRERSQTHRIYTDLRTRFNLGEFRMEPLRLGLRLRYQNNFYRDEVHEQALRPKLSVGYKIKSIDLDVDAFSEIFYSFSKFEKEFDQYRLGLGLSYQIAKRNQLNFSYFYRKDFNVSNPLNAHIFVAELAVSLNKKKKEKPE